MNSATTGKKPLLRVLHIGITGRGRWPLQHCNESTGFASTALCDLNAEALEKTRLEFGLDAASCFTDVDKAIFDAKIDCAIVCTPTIFHVPIGLKMIDAGIPVLIEKGMAPDWDSATRLVNAATGKKAVVAIAQNYRYAAMERTLWRAIHDADFPAYVGEVHQITYSEQRVRPVPNTLNYPFASVWDMSCHHFDNLQYWLGPVEEMTAFSWSAKWSAYKYDNNTSAHIVFGNGARVHYIHTHDAARILREIELHGERGALCLRDGKLWFNERPTENFGKRPLVEVPFVEAHNESDMLLDFHAYVTEGIEPGISAQNNLQTMMACEMMVRSLSQKRTLHRSEFTTHP